MRTRVAVLLGLSLYHVAAYADFRQEASYDAFRERMTSIYQFEAAEIDFLISQAEYKPQLLRIMNTPGESKEWYDYRSQFLTESKISKGVAFAALHRAALERAELRYGVPASVILGILGVETAFGSNKGGFRAIDALATLGFGYPRRSEYFMQELAELLLLAREQNTSALNIYSSYAGAMGYPQFMPSSVRKYAVDFDGDGKIQLISSATDAIGSIAHYLAEHGWQKNQPIAQRGKYSGSDDSQIIATDLTKPKPFAELKQKGLLPSSGTIDDGQLVNGIRLIERDAPAYFITYPNFQVITTYNRSRMYAAAVWQLGQAIEARQTQ